MLLPIRRSGHNNNSSSNNNNNNNNTTITAIAILDIRQLHTRTLHTRTAIHRHSLRGVTSRRRGFEIGIECLLVAIAVIKPKGN